jgi:hypothetical protein
MINENTAMVTLAVTGVNLDETNGGLVLDAFWRGLQVAIADPVKATYLLGMWEQDFKRDVAQQYVDTLWAMAQGDVQHGING